MCDSQTLVVAHQPAATHQPREGALHHPAAGEHGEAFLVGGALDDLNGDLPGALDELDELSARCRRS